MFLVFRLNFFQSHPVTTSLLKIGLFITCFDLFSKESSQSYDFSRKLDKLT